jgi:hypothetical protein
MLSDSVAADRFSQPFEQASEMGLLAFHCGESIFHCGESVLQTLQALDESAVAAQYQSGECDANGTHGQQLGGHTAFLFCEQTDGDRPYLP